MNLADRVFAITDIELCSNRLSVFDHLFDQIKQNIERNVSTNKFDGSSQVVNSYSKRYMLNEFVNKCNPNKLYSVTLQEYLILSTCLNNKQKI